MVMKQLYKNLYYDEEQRKYFFFDGKDRRELADQTGYLLVYILEVLLKK